MLNVTIKSNYKIYYNTNININFICLKINYFIKFININKLNFIKIINSIKLLIHKLKSIEIIIVIKK